MRNYSYEISACDGRRVACEDYFPTLGGAEDKLKTELKDLPNGYTALLYRRYADGEWGSEISYVKHDGKVFSTKE